MLVTEYGVKMSPIDLFTLVFVAEVTFLAKTGFDDDKFATMNEFSNENGCLTFLFARC